MLYISCSLYLLMCRLNCMSSCFFFNFHDSFSLYISITSCVNCTRCSKMHIFIISSLPGAVYKYFRFLLYCFRKRCFISCLYFIIFSLFICIYYYFLLFLCFIFLFFMTHVSALILRCQ